MKNFVKTSILSMPKICWISSGFRRGTIHASKTLAMLRLNNKYSEAHLEAVYEFAITQRIKKTHYHHFNLILSSNQDEIYLEKERCYKGRQLYRVSAQKWLLRRGEMINEETWRASGTKYKEIRQQT